MSATPSTRNAYPGEHEAIINKEVWDQVQALLTENAIHHEKGSITESPVF